MADLKRSHTLTHKITRVADGAYDDITIVGDTGLMKIAISTPDHGEIELCLEAARHLESALYDQIQLLNKAQEEAEQNG